VLRDTLFQVTDRFTDNGRVVTVGLLWQPMKTRETTEEVSLHAVEKRGERSKKHGNTPSAGEKPKTNRQNGLQICGEGSISRKRPALFVGKKSNGESQFINLPSNAGVKNMAAIIYHFSIVIYTLLALL
jgi:hypothetical protein